MDILEEARNTVKTRGESYQHPEGNFGRIARMWGAYLNTTLTIEDVGMMMILLKVARNNPSMSLDSKRDTGVDIVGYIHALDMAGCFPPSPADRLPPEEERKAWESGVHFNGIPTKEQIDKAWDEAVQQQRVNQLIYPPGA